MRKHFLILMLMALLPLAGWAQTAEFGEIGVGKYTYGDASFPVPVVKDKEGAILAETYYVVDVNVAYADEACTQEIHKAIPAELAAMKADGTTKYWIKVTGKPETAYAGQVGKAWFMVDKADLTITYTESLDRYYGDDQVALDETKFSVAGFMFGEDWDDIKKGSAPTGYSTADNNAGEDKEVTFVGGWTADNYNIVYNVKLTINPLDISTPAEITEEQGDIVYTGTDFVGVYTIKLGDKTLTAGAPAVLYADVDEYNTAKGTSLTDVQFGALSEYKKTKVAATGDYHVASVRNASTAAYHPTITFHGNYTGTKSPATGFKIAKAPITVSLKKDIHRTYTGTDYNAVNVVGNVAAVSYASAAEYNSFNGTSLTTAQFEALSDAEKIRIAAIPAAEFNYSGIVGDDIAHATEVKAEFTAPTSAVYAGAAADKVIKVNDDGYALTISGGSAGDGGTYNKNYEFKTFLPGKLIIDPVKLYIRAKDQVRSVAETDKANDFYAYGLVNAETVSGLTYTREPGTTVGVYEITPNIEEILIKKGNDDRTSSYIVSLAEPKGKLTITPAAIVVTILEAEKNYGEKDPEFDYAVTGCAKEVVGTVTINREPGEAAGFYALTAEVANPDPTKYASLTVVPGILTINKAPLTFTMPVKNVVTDDEVDALTKDGILVEGINNSDDPATLYTLAFNGLEEDVDITAAGAIKNVNKHFTAGYMAVLTEAAQANYVVDGVNAIVVAPSTVKNAATGKLVINKGDGVDIALTCENTDYDQIITNAGETVDVTINFANRNRTFGTTEYGSWKAEYWASMVLPFDVTVAELSGKLGYAIVNVIDKDGYKTDGEGNPVFKFKLTMKGGNGSTEVLKANRPFVIKLDRNVPTTDIEFENKKIVAPTAADVLEAGGGATFEGTYLTKTVTPSDNDCWFLLGDYEKGWAFINGSANSSVWNWDIISTEGFIKTTVAAREATFIMEELDGSTTALKSISADSTNDVKAEGWYTINGMKLNTVPTQKGIYINNGKKIVVK